MMFQESGNNISESTNAKISNLESSLLPVDTLFTSLQNKVLSFDWGGIVKDIQSALSVLLPEEFAKKFEALDQESAKIRNSLGLGSEKSKQLSLMVADNISRFAELGYKATDVADTLTGVFSVYGANIGLTNDDLLTLKATSEVTDVKVDTLASSFRNVGIGVRQVGDRMLEVTEVARNAGVSVSAVAKGVTENIDKMNLYNFENGVKGLARMSAQATRLGFDMKSIFAVVEQVFNPEGAIELSAAMQRLGVQTNALLDPLRLMDLSQNDPEELSNQIVNMSKEFVRFNKELNQFEILPGEKRRLNEIGKALNMNSGELQKMAINAATLDMKMKQIKFPSSIATKEDRELIATLATVNEKGIAQVRVRVREIDEKTGEWTGRDTMKDVSQLRPEDIKELKAGQELQGKTMEELAIDQLSEAEKSNAKLAQIYRAMALGITTGKAGADFYEFRTKTVREKLFQEKGRTGGIISEEERRTGTWRKRADNVTDAVTGTFNDIVEKLKQSGSLEEIKGYYNTINNGFNDVFNTLKSVDFSNFLGFDINSILTDIGQTFGIGGSETDLGSNFTTNKTNTKISTTNVSNRSLNTNATPAAMEIKPIDINEKIDVNITVTLDPNIKDQRLTDIATNAINEYFKGGQNSGNVDTVTKAIDLARSSQKIVTSNIPTKSYVNVS